MEYELSQRSRTAMRILMPSTNASVELAVRECETFMKGQGGGSTLGAQVVLRELLANAVVHGNRNAANRRVGITIENLGASQFRLHVEDEGNGFDVSSIDMSLPDDPRNLQKRGYILINSLSDRLEFNDKGNRVTAYVTLPEQES